VSASEIGKKLEIDVRGIFFYLAALWQRMFTFVVPFTVLKPTYVRLSLVETGRFGPQASRCFFP
jgi:hypothetical protein